jgi:hypothetical protein
VSAANLQHCCSTPQSLENTSRCTCLYCPRGLLPLEHFVINNGPLQSAGCNKQPLCSIQPHHSAQPQQGLGLALPSSHAGPVGQWLRRCTPCTPLLVFPCIGHRPTCYCSGSGLGKAAAYGEASSTSPGVTWPCGQSNRARTCPLACAAHTSTWGPIHPGLLLRQGRSPRCTVKREALADAPYTQAGAGVATGST